jgi:hypothetical protein
MPAGPRAPCRPSLSAGPTLLVKSRVPRGKPCVFPGRAAEWPATQDSGRLGAAGSRSFLRRKMNRSSPRWGGGLPLPENVVG